MIKLYKQFFYVPKHAKVSDKVMLVRVGVTVAIMVICLFAMTFTAYAYFTANVIVSANNYIKSSKYELDIMVNDGENDIVLTDNEFVATAGKKYTVTLKYVEGSAATGFGIIKVGDRIYHTQQIGNDIKAEHGKRTETTFDIEVTGIGEILVEFLAHWGTSSHYIQSEDGELLYITNGNTIDLEIVDNGLVKLYTVVEGDNLRAIASLFGTTVNKLVAYNQIEDPDVIRVGEVIKIPPSSWVIPTYEPESP